MQKQMFQEHPPERRKKFLDDNADSIETVSYVKQFTHEELTDFKDKLATSSIKINHIEIEKKKEMDIFKAKLKPLQDERKEYLEKIYKKSETVEEQCFKLVDHEAGEVGFYNELGELVYQRPIMQSEMQTTIYSLPKTAEQ